MLSRLAERAVDHPRNPFRLPERPQIEGDSKRDAAFDRLLAGGASSPTTCRTRNGSCSRARSSGMARSSTARPHRPHPVRAARGDDVRGRDDDGVFATPDPIWPIFFAVFDKERGNTFWNQCLLPDELRVARTRQFFSVGGDVKASWTDGAVYLLPAVTFAMSDAPAEWVSADPVEPFARLPVSRADFPFADRVFRHRWRAAPRSGERRPHGVERPSPGPLNPHNPVVRSPQ